MEILKTKDLSFTYPNEEEKAISNINLSVKSGEILLLCGASGCGKTTLLRQLKKEIAMQGHREGHIYFRGEVLEHLPEIESASQISYLFQNPDNQIVMGTVRGEIAFSLENLGVPSADIKRRIGEMVAYFGIGNILSSPTDNLSGGQKQIVNLCALLAGRPTLLLLDEPLSQLDPISQSEFISIISRVNRDFGTTVIIAEHCTEEIMPLADKVAMMEQGEIVLYGKPEAVATEVFRNVAKKNFQNFFPTATHISHKVGEISLTVRKTKEIIHNNERFADFFSRPENPMKKESKVSEKKPIVQGKNLFFQYHRNSPMILDGLNISLEEGDFAAILGSNGAGKSTLIQILAGLLPPIDGALSFMGEKYSKLRKQGIYSKIGYVPQNPRLTFTCDTVLEELNLATGFATKNNLETYMSQLFEVGFDFTHLYHRHPYDLSGGETQRLALYSALLKGQRVLLLDEVTKGLDPQAKHNISGLLKNLTRKGITILMVTHDIEFAAANAEKFAMIFDGGMSEWQSKQDFFNGNCFYTTSTKRIFGDKLKEVVTIDDLEALL